MILGHAQVETTRRYARTSRERLREAIESVRCRARRRGGGERAAASGAPAPVGAGGDGRAVEGEGRCADAGRARLGSRGRVFAPAADDRCLAITAASGRVPAGGSVGSARALGLCDRARGTISNACGLAASR